MITGLYEGQLSVFSKSTEKSHFSNRDWAVFEDYSTTLKEDCSILLLDSTSMRRTENSLSWENKEETLNLKYTQLFWKCEHIWGLHHPSKIDNFSDPHICSLTISRFDIRKYIVRWNYWHGHRGHFLGKEQKWGLLYNVRNR